MKKHKVKGTCRAHIVQGRFKGKVIDVDFSKLYQKKCILINGKDVSDYVEKFTITMDAGDLHHPQIDITFYEVLA